MSNEGPESPFSPLTRAPVTVEALDASRRRTQPPRPPRARHPQGQSRLLQRLLSWANARVTSGHRFASGQHVVISGVPGLGKTELALAVGHAWATGVRTEPQAPRTLIWLSRPHVEPWTHATDMVNVALHDEGPLRGDGLRLLPVGPPLADQPLRGLMQLLQRQLADRRGLLVLDDVDRWEPVAELVPGPAWKVLITTRDPTLARTIPDARHLPLAPLSAPNARAVVRSAAWPDGALTPARSTQLRQLQSQIDLCHGVPLLLEILGAWAARDLDQIVGSHEPHARDVLVARLNQCTVHEWCVLHSLAIFPRTAIHLEHLTLATGTPESLVADSVERLKSGGIIQSQGALILLEDRQREAIRAHLRFDAEAWKRVHLAVARALYRIVEPLRGLGGPGSARAQQRWLEVQDLFGMIEPAEWAGQREAAKTLARALLRAYDFQRRRPPEDSVHTRLQDGVEALAQDDDAVMAQRELERGRLACRRRSPDEARTCFQRASRRARLVLDLDLMVQCCVESAWLGLEHGHEREVSEAYREVNELWIEPVSDRSRLLVAELEGVLWQLGRLEGRGRNALDEAERCFRAAIQRADRLSDQKAGAQGRRRLAQLLNTRRLPADLDEAERVCTEAIQLLDALGATAERVDLGMLYHERGVTRTSKRDHLRARDDLDRAEERFGGEGSREHRQRNLLARISLAMEAQDLRSAALNCHDLARLCDAEGDRHYLGHVYLTQSELSRMSGRTFEALTQAQDALQAFQRAGLRHEQAHTLGALAELYSLQGDLAQARSGLNEAIALRVQLGDRFGLASTLCSRLFVLRKANETAEAMRLARELRQLGHETGNAYAEFSAAQLLEPESTLLGTRFLLGPMRGQTVHDGVDLDTPRRQPVTIRLVRGDVTRVSGELESETHLSGQARTFLPGAVAEVLMRGYAPALQTSFIVYQCHQTRPFPGPLGTGGWAALAPTVGQVLEILHQLHQNGITHGNLSSDTLRVGLEGQPVLIGLKGEGAEPSAAQLERTIGRSDVRSLAALVLQALGPQGAAVEDPHDPAAAALCPPAITRVLLDAISDDPELRPASARGLAYALELVRRFEPRWLGRKVFLEFVDALGDAQRQTGAAKHAALVGERGHGRTFALREAERELRRRGFRPLWVARHGSDQEDPFASVAALLGDGSIERSLGEAGHEGREAIAERVALLLSGTIGRRLVLLVDDPGPAGFDGTTAALLRNTQNVHTLFACTPEAPRLRETERVLHLSPLSQDDLLELFDGKDRVFRERRRAAHHLHRLSGGIPARLVVELARWLRMGWAEALDGKLRVPRWCHGYLELSLPTTPVVPEITPPSNLSRRADILLDWLSLAGPDTSVELLYEAMTLPRWVVEHLLNEVLLPAGLVHRIQTPAGPRYSSLVAWRSPLVLPEERAQNRLRLAILPACPDVRRLRHLASADDPRVIEVAARVARDRRASGQADEALAALRLALVVLDRIAHRGAEISTLRRTILVEWIMLGVVEGSLSILRGARRALQEEAHADPGAHLLERLVEALIDACFGQSAETRKAGRQQLSGLRSELRHQDLERICRLVPLLRDHDRTDEEREALLRETEAWAERELPAADRPYTLARIAGRRAVLAYEAGRYKEAARHQHYAAEQKPPSAGKALSTLLEATSLMEIAEELPRARAQLQKARDLFEAYPHVRHEALLEIVERSLLYREQRASRSAAPLAADPELLQIVRELDLPEHVPGLLILEAAILWREAGRLSGDATPYPRELARQRAEEACTAARAVERHDLALLAQALAHACGLPLDEPGFSRLLRDAVGCVNAIMGLEIAGLAGIAARQQGGGDWLRPRQLAPFYRLLDDQAAPAQRTLRHSVLSIAECLRPWGVSADYVPPVKPRPSTWPELLDRCLVDLFDFAELTLFLGRLDQGEALLRRVLVPGASQEETFQRAATALMGDGYIGEELFQALRGARPSRSEDIDALEAAWKAASLEDPGVTR